MVSTAIATNVTTTVVTTPRYAPVAQVFVESTGDESILGCEVVDQAKLQAVLSWLYAHGVEIVSVMPDDDWAESVVDNLQIDQL